MDIGHLVSQYFAGNDHLYSLSGLFVGILVGLTGVGGGSLMTPILVLLFGVHPATAVGTDLLYASVTKMFGTVVHGSKRNVDWKIVGLLAIGSVPTAAIAIWFIRENGESAAFTKFMKDLLGVTLIITCFLVLLRSRLLEFAHKNKDPDPKLQSGLTVIVGVVLGGLVALTSVGAGAIGVTAMILLYHRLPIVRLVGSDIAHAVPLTMVAGMGYFMIGAVNIPMLISLLIGSIPGIILGSWLAPKVPEKIIRYMLAAVLALVGYKMLTK